MQRLPASLHWQYKNYRDYWPSLFISGKNTSSALHADWANSAAWMGLMSGKKRWRIVHPRDRPLLYEDPMKKNVFPSDLFNHDDKNFPNYKILKGTKSNENLLGQVGNNKTNGTQAYFLVTS